MKSEKPGVPVITTFNELDNLCSRITARAFTPQLHISNKSHMPGGMGEGQEGEEGFGHMAGAAGEGGRGGPIKTDVIRRRCKTPAHYA